MHQNLYDGSSKEYGEFLAKAKANAVAKITSEQVYGCGAPFGKRSMNGRLCALGLCISTKLIGGE